MSDKLRAGVRVEGGRLGRLGVVLIAAGALVMVGAMQGCGDDDDDNGPVAGSSGKSGSGGTGGSAGAGGGSGTGGGAGSGGDAGQGGSAGNGGGPAVPQPTKLAFSPTAQDRLLGVTYDKSGNLYATGIIADAAGDLSTLVTKIKADGTLDAAFGTSGVASTNVAVGKGGEVMRGVVVQSTGKIVVAGTVEAKGATDERDRDIALVRFDATGKLDETFGEGGVVTFSLSEGAKVGEKNYVADSQWGLSVYGDDKLLVVCSKKADGVDRTDSDFAVVRRLADGAPDDGFGTGGVLTLPDDKRSVSVRTSTILPDGSAVVAGYTTELVGEVVSPVVFKIGADGKLDSGFGTGGVFNEIVLPAVTEAYAAVLQGDKLVTAGYGRAAPTEKLDAVSLRLTSTGVLDPTWGTAGVVRVDVAGLDDRARSLSVLPDGRIALVGGAQQVADNADAMVTVLNASGQPDATFAPNGRMIYDLGGTGDFFWGSAVSPDGKTLAAIGYNSSADTTLDDSFVLLVPLSQ